jgi:hypothetical protein
VSIYKRTRGILECKTRQEESYLYPKLPHTYVLYMSLISYRSRSGSIVNNMNDVDDQTRDKPK